MKPFWKTWAILVPLLCAATFALATAGKAQDQRRVALVIGNSGYEHVPSLNNPANDAADIAAALTRLGFQVTSGQDYDYRQMRLALRDFADAATKADFAVVYFAGHGIEINKTNYLIPVNAELKNDRDVEFEAITLDSVLNTVAYSAGVKIVLVDACRNNPFNREMNRTIATRSLGRGLARVDPVGGVLVGYAAREGTVAQDGAGRNSPYAKALLEHLEQPGLEIGKLFRKVRDSVYAMTNGQQEPFTYGSLPGSDIFLVPPVTQASKPAVQPMAPLPDDTSTLITDFTTAEEAGTLVAWMMFLDAYGTRTENSLVRIAQKRHDELQAERDQKQRALTRKPWLKPKAGLPGGGPVTLNKSERMLVQKSLNYLGFYTGRPDGQFGPKTKSAIASARIELGLFASNYVDAALLRNLPNVLLIDELKTKKATFYGDVDVSELLEPRLARAIEFFGDRYQFKFDYFRGHLYLALLSNSSAGFDYWNLLARKVDAHLATITSSEENTFIYNLFAADERFFHTHRNGLTYGPHFGLYQPDRSREPNGGWAWVTGEPLRYTNWARGEPDNFKNRHHYGRFMSAHKLKFKSKRAIFWDDGELSWPGKAYIIEFD